MMRLTHLSLFSGIGGIDIAAEWAGFQTVGQCEIDEYATKVLEKHWPGVPRWKDIHDLRADDIFTEYGNGGGHYQITVLSGGFPCQPHSIAGKRKASGDERDLWPEYRRLIRELRPRWVVAENVRGLLSSEDGRFFGRVLSDLAGMGFDVGWCVYRASDVGAIHPRERVFTVAHINSERQPRCDNNRGTQQDCSNGKGSTEKSKQEGERFRTMPNAYTAHDTNAKSVRLQTSCEEGFRQDQPWVSCDYCDVEDWTRRCNDFKPKLLRDTHGLSGGAYEHKQRITCLGNAVVPQQVYPIFRAIAEIERGGNK